jgi:hypothetical protein
VYHPTEHLTVDEVIPMKHKIFGIKNNLCYSLRYVYAMRTYIAKQRKDATADLTPAYGNVMQLGRRVEDVGHKLYVDN